MYWFFSDGYVVINPYDPHKKMQKWIIKGKKIQNRIDTQLVLQLCNTSDGPGSRITTGEYIGNQQQQHWEIYNVYVCLTLHRLPYRNV